MTPTGSHTQDQIFRNMLRELRSWNPEISESPERMDPILRILVQMYAGQLARIDQRIDQIWDVASQSLIRSVCPETRRWPIPAFTVMKCDLSDPIVDIDTNTRFFYRELRDGGGLYFFTPQRSERLVRATVTGAFVVAGEKVIPLSLTAKPGDSTPDSKALTDTNPRLFLAVEFDGRISDLSETIVFLRGNPEALALLRWSHWYASYTNGSFAEESGFCPGRQNTIERMFSPDGIRPRLWGSLRTSADIFAPLVDQVVMLPEAFVAGWKPVPADRPVAGMFDPLPVPTPASQRFWIELRLPERGKRASLLDGIGVDFGCFIATNRNELSLFKHTAGNRVIDIELPESIEEVHEIVSVTDSRGTEYRPRYEVSDEDIANSYTLQDTEDRLVLWFDFTSQASPPPDSLTVRYATTAGIGANGIDPGRINELYESHPGIKECRNLIVTQGAIPAKSAQQIVTEVSVRLRGRDKALTFADVTAWVRTFDPRVRSVACENGVQRTEHGVRRCIVVQAEVAADDFRSRDEVELLRSRLNGFLKARSPINTHYEIEMVRT